MNPEHERMRKAVREETIAHYRREYARGAFRRFGSSIVATVARIARGQFGKRRKP